MLKISPQRKNSFYFEGKEKKNIQILFLQLFPTAPLVRSECEFLLEKHNDDRERKGTFISWAAVYMQAHIWNYKFKLELENSRRGNDKIKINKMNK